MEEIKLIIDVSVRNMKKQQCVVCEKWANNQLLCATVR